MLYFPLNNRFVIVNNMEYGNATGRTRKEARESAAREALLVLRHYA